MLPAEERGAPCVVGIMCGPRAPLETALCWLGWHVRTYDKLGTQFNPPADLLDAAVREQATEDIELADFVSCAMDCSTLADPRDPSLRTSPTTTAS